MTAATHSLFRLPFFLLAAVAGLSLAVGYVHADEVEGDENNSPTPWGNSLGIPFLPLGESNLRMAIHPVRVSDYRLFVEATGNPWPSPPFPQEADHPAVQVSWEDAVRFCQWLTRREQEAGALGPQQRYRLPTEAEWRMMLAPTEPGAYFPWGNDWPPPEDFGNYGAELRVDPYEFTSPVTAFPPNAKGFHDTSGNTWDWTADRYQNSFDLRVLLGGSWRMRDASDLSLENRVGNVLHLRLPTYGFRLLLEGE